MLINALVVAERDNNESLKPLVAFLGRFPWWAARFICWTTRGTITVWARTDKLRPNLSKPAKLVVGESSKKVATWWGTLCVYPCDWKLTNLNQRPTLFGSGYQWLGPPHSAVLATSVLTVPLPSIKRQEAWFYWLFTDSQGKNFYFSLRWWSVSLLL